MDTFALTWQQIVGLFVLAIPIACVARTVVFEEVFREPREWCKYKSTSCNRLVSRKFFYLFTCEYCFSHWVTGLFLYITGYRLMYPGDWRGYLVAFFSLVFVANSYMNVYARLRVELASEKKHLEAKEKEIAMADMELKVKDQEVRRMNAELSDGNASLAADSLPRLSR